MNRYFKLTLFELLSTIIAIAGFFTIILELKETKETLNAADNLIHSALSSQMSTWTIEIDKQFIQHPELRVYFYDGTALDTNDSKYDIAANVAELMLDAFDAVLGNRYYKLNDQEKKMWSLWVRASFKQSPVLCHVFDETRDWYSQEVGAIYQELNTTK